MVPDQTKLIKAITVWTKLILVKPLALMSTYCQVLPRGTVTHKGLGT